VLVIGEWVGEVLLFGVGFVGGFIECFEGGYEVWIGYMDLVILSSVLWFDVCIGEMIIWVIVLGVVEVFVVMI